MVRVISDLHETHLDLAKRRKYALTQCQQNVDEGYIYVVDMDLEKFFDTVCQSKLI